jgi:FkbM family methyltransferase
MFLYNLVDKFLMNDFSDLVIRNLNKKNNIIFDVGCFNGNYSRNLKKKINYKNSKFYLFDANPNLKIKGFKYINEIFYNKIIRKNFYYNEFFPASGSSLEPDTMNDHLWNLTRKLITLSPNKGFSTLRVITNTIDNFCKKKKIKKIDLLKIDVDGSELKVIEGCKKILNNTKLLQLEIYQKKENFTKIEKKIKILLKGYNFKLIKEKKIFSVSLFSGLKGKDLLFLKQ